MYSRKRNVYFYINSSWKRLKEEIAFKKKRAMTGLLKTHA